MSHHKSPEGEVYARLICDTTIDQLSPLASLVALAKADVLRALSRHDTLQAAADELRVSRKTIYRLRDALNALAAPAQLHRDNSSHEPQ